MLKKVAVFTLAAVFTVPAFGSVQEEKPPEKNFFENSLHHTSRGLAFWYAKEQGGVERLTGAPITALNCLDCHVQTCDACHARKANGIQIYSTEEARSQKACIACHGFGDVDKMKADKQFVDLHLEKGMKCMDCHTSREVHGDGNIYQTYRQEGALDAKCSNCHQAAPATPSHKVHGDKLDCNTCHIQELSSCHNCHMDTRIRDKKSHSLPLERVFFLVNSRGRVTLATCLTFVAQNKTMVEFSPSFPHTVGKQGRACPECHASKVVKDIKDKKFRPAVWKDGKLESVRGVVPVLEGMNWNFPFFDRQGDSWIPLKSPARPVIQYSGYCTPLTQEQFKKLEKLPTVER